jgi:DNA-binding SARP family transcriptional activator/tetratricopeptide (TPR) repeat protein
MATTMLTLLGRPCVVHDGAAHELPAERRCQVLALLALRREWVARGELAALFWPGQRSELAATNLRKALHFARALPWAAALEAPPGALRFQMATDVQAVEAAHREGRIADALAHCRGTLLDGMDDTSNQAWTDWLVSERARHVRRVHELHCARLTQLEGQPEACIALARELLGADPLDEDAVVALLGAQRALGRLAEQREAYRSFELRLAEELGVEPSSRVRRQLREAPSAPSAGGAEAGGAGGSFFGRAKELDELADRLARDDCRLLTVIGPGGVGKSTLLKHALRRIEPRFADAALWIALDDLQDIAQVPVRIAAELKLTLTAQQELLPPICAHFASRQMLLVFDNGEHLPGLGELALRLLNAAPRLKVCVTSRARLGAQGEWLLPLAGLEVPGSRATPRELLANDAVRLFVASASAVTPAFDAPAQAAAIGALVRAIQGLPLAILLAADWVRLLPVAEIVQELEASLDVLDSGDAEGEERPEHRSMRATFERSWQMLATREQNALATLSVFVGTFSRQAAQDVAGAALPLLAALADKSLLQMPGGGRCSLHPLIRQFSIGKLGAEEYAQASHRHADWFMPLLTRLGRGVERGDLRSLDAIEDDLENCRQAWRWAVSMRRTDSLAACASVLMRFFEVRGRTLEGLDLLLEAQAAVCNGPAPPPACAANLSASIAHLQFRMYRLDEAAASARRGLVYARAAASRAAHARCLNVLGICHYLWGKNLQAKRFYEQAVRQAHAANDTHTVSAAQSNLAMIEKELGNYDSAEQSMLAVLGRQREWGDWVRVVSLLNNLAAVYLARGKWLAARGCLDEGIQLCDAHGIEQVRPHLLVNLALVSCYVADDDEAQRLSRQALAVARALAERGAEAPALINLVRLAVRRGDCVEAGKHLHEAIASSASMQNPSVQLDCVLAFATIRAAQGQAHCAAALLRYFLARPQIEPVGRAEAEACLAGLPGDAANTPAPDIALALLVQDIADELERESR